MGDHVQYYHHDIKVKTKIMCFKLQNYQNMASKLREEMGDLQQRRPWPEPPERGRGDVALCRDWWTESSFGESQIASLVGSLGDSTKRKVQNSKKIGLLSDSLAMFLLSPPYIVYFLFSTMGIANDLSLHHQLASSIQFCFYRFYSLTIVLFSPILILITCSIWQVLFGHIFTD